MLTMAALMLQNRTPYVCYVPYCHTQLVVGGPYDYHWVHNHHIESFTD